MRPRLAEVWYLCGVVRLRFAGVKFLRVILTIRVVVGMLSTARQRGKLGAQHFHSAAGMLLPACI